jgi:Zn-dependent protease
VVVHEFSHAFVAWHAGDDTVLAKGYLSLDPLKYADLLTSLILPVVFLAMGGIGFPGAAVYLQEDLMRSRTWRSLSSLAGPMGTLAVLIVIAVILKLGSGVMGAPLVAALAFLAFLQATSLILNLLPVPGLDGYGVIRPFLPQHVRQALRKFEPIAFIGLFAILWLVPIANTLLFLGAAGLAQLMGVQFDDVVAGMQAFRFWKAL